VKEEGDTALGLDGEKPFLLKIITRVRSVGEALIPCGLDVGMVGDSLSVPSFSRKIVMPGARNPKQLGKY
jgi:hypothetical protein